MNGCCSRELSVWLSLLCSTICSFILAKAHNWYARHLYKILLTTEMFLCVVVGLGFWVVGFFLFWFGFCCCCLFFSF